MMIQNESDRINLKMERVKRETDFDYLARIIYKLLNDPETPGEIAASELLTLIQEVFSDLIAEVTD